MLFEKIFICASPDRDMIQIAIQPQSADSKQDSSSDLDIDKLKACFSYRPTSPELYHPPLCTQIHEKGADGTHYLYFSYKDAGSFNLIIDRLKHPDILASFLNISLADVIINQNDLVFMSPSNSKSIAKAMLDGWRAQEPEKHHTLKHSTRPQPNPCATTITICKTCKDPEDNYDDSNYCKY